MGIESYVGRVYDSKEQLEQLGFLPVPVVWAKIQLYAYGYERILVDPSKEGKLEVISQYRMDHNFRG